MARHNNVNQSKDRKARLLKLLGVTAEEMDARIKGVFDEAKREVFGPPMVWPDESGLTVRRLSDIAIKPLPVPAADHPLLIAARTAFPNSQSHAVIVHRFRDLYDGIPQADAVAAILSGFTSPAHAMQAGQLKRRPLKTR